MANTQHLRQNLRLRRERKTKINQLQSKRVLTRSVKQMLPRAEKVLRESGREGTFDLDKDG